MFSRPAFLDRFSARLPDVRSLRSRVLGGVGVLSVSFGALLVLAAAQLDARRCAEVARTRAVTLAETAGMWLDGDAHAKLGPAPEKRLDDLSATLEKLLEASDYEGVVRTLRPRAESKAALAAQPGARRAGALEVVLQTGKGPPQREVDYQPEMEEVLFDGKSTSVLVAGRVEAYAPVPDSWGAVPALVWVSGPATAPFWRRLVFWIGAVLFASLLVGFALLLARRAGEALELQIATLDSGVRELAAGRMPSPFALARAPSELDSLAASLESLRSRLEAQATGQPLPAANDGVEDARRAVLGEPADFDLALLVQQLVEPARQQAGQRGIELQLTFPDALPAPVVGHPMAIFRALDCLLRNSLRTTTQGRISLRVSRVGGGADSEKLRFEVTDSSQGIAFKEQQELAASLAEAAGKDPSTLTHPLSLASAIARALGGELAFESQPGQGSRFGFTACFGGLGPPPATGFHARAATAFQPRAAAPLGPPVSSFVPRKSLRTR